MIEKFLFETNFFYCCNDIKNISSYYETKDPESILL